jgi:hypothetical protein
MRKWIFMTLLIPFAAWAMYVLAGRREERHGSTRVTRALRAPHRWRRRWQGRAA